MRPLAWWVQDHLGLAAIGVLGVAAIAVAVVLAVSGGPSATPRAQSKVAAARSSTKGSAQTAAPTPRKVRHRARQGGVASSATRRPAHHRREHRRRVAGTGHATVAGGASKGARESPEDLPKHAATHTSANPPKVRPTSSAGHSLGKATADQVAATHPGVTCPSGYSRAECERVVEAAAHPAPPTPVSSPADCGKAMSATQCEELFAAEEAARANGTASVTAKECIAHPELPACAAAVEQMEAEYEAAHPGG